MARRAAALRYSRPQGRPVSLLPSDVSQRLSRSRRTGVAHGLPGRRHQLQRSPCRAHEDRSRHRRRGGRRPRTFRRAQQRRRQPLQLPLRPHRRRRHGPVHRRRCRPAQDVPAEGRVHVERRFLGLPRVDSVGARDWARPSTRALSDRRHPGDARDVPDRLQRQAHPAGARDQPLALQRRRDLRAGTRQRGGEHARHLRREGPPPRAHDPQHGYFRHVGTRRGGRRVPSTASRRKDMRSPST